MSTLGIGSLIKPGIFFISSLGAGILYSLLASEMNDYFADDRTATTWMSAVIVMSLILTLVLLTTGCGDDFNIKTSNGSYTKNYIAVSALVSVIANGLLAFVYNISKITKKNYFIFAAVIQFMILSFGTFLTVRSQITNSPQGQGNRPVAQQQNRADMPPVINLNK